MKKINKFFNKLLMNRKQKIKIQILIKWDIDKNR